MSCAAGKWGDHKGASSADACSDCPAGTASRAPGAASLQDCLPQTGGDGEAAQASGAASAVHGAAESIDAASRARRPQSSEPSSQVRHVLIEIWNLDHAKLSPEDKAILSRRFADDISTACGVEASLVKDRDWQPGRVTLTEDSHLDFFIQLAAGQEASGLASVFGSGAFRGSLASSVALVLGPKSSAVTGTLSVGSVHIKDVLAGEAGAGGSVFGIPRAIALALGIALVLLFALFICGYVCFLCAARKNKRGVPRSLAETGDRWREPGGAENKQHAMAMASTREVEEVAPLLGPPPAGPPSPPGTPPMAMATVYDLQLGAPGLPNGFSPGRAPPNGFPPGLPPGGPASAGGPPLAGGPCSPAGLPQHASMATTPQLAPHMDGCAGTVQLPPPPAPPGALFTMPPRTLPTQVPAQVPGQVPMAGQAPGMTAPALPPMSTVQLASTQFARPRTDGLFQ